MELLLRQVKYQIPTKLASRGSACPMGIHGSPDPSFTDTPKSPQMKTTRTRCSRPTLPPIAGRKDQDLLRQPGEMWGQRVHYPEMMLGLQTTYTQLEEAQNHLGHHERLEL
ncbi:unnamed protein product [Ophioblennius macclurei]